MDHLLPGLLRRAHLFDDPAAYEAGVRAAIDAVTACSDAATTRADVEERAARMAQSRRAHPSAGRGRALRAV